MTQTLVVAVLVAACSLRAAWILAPAAVRRAVARALLSWPLPRALATPLRKHARAASAGCACDGCDSGSAAQAKKAAPVVAPITFHRRLPR
ncbi:MAG TPA: hypothetical protein VGO85_11460 [Caldimonas sp.]|jgi:hypothetical protein|nr:hypothetical protein [Caldimonas sp.]